MPTSSAWNPGHLPFLRILIPFTAGILLEAHDILPARGWMVAIPATCALLRVAASGMPLRAGQVILVKSATLQCLLFGMGMMAAWLHRESLFVHRESPYSSPHATAWMLVFREPPEKGPNTHRAESELWKNDGKGAFEYKGVCLVRFRLKEGVAAPDYGTRIVTLQAPEPILYKGNPGGFDAENHYRRRGIAVSIFLEEGRYMVLPGTDRNGFMAWAYQTRDRILGILQQYIRNPEALGIAEALLIGYRGHLDDAVADAYAGTGVIHVIAISGLHIGMLYAIAMGVAGLLMGHTEADRYRPTAVLPLLWIFGLMSGASASVMRSVCMFTVMALGRSLLGRRGRPLNTLCATAFLLLAFRPLWIEDIGFQLSFTAVAGIMLFHPAIRSLAPFENRAAAYVWDMVALTLSAQLLTTPLILHHFGRFPLLFLFTNIVAIPLSSLILLAELLLCAASPFPEAARLLGEAIETAILWMNRYVADMDGIPHTTLEDVGLSGLSTILLYLAIAAAYRAFAEHTPGRRMAALAIACLFCASVSWESLARHRQERLVIPHLKGRSALFAVEGVDGRWHITPDSSKAAADHDRQMRAMERHLKVVRSETHETAAAAMGSFEWKGIRILSLGKGAPKDPPSLPFKPDLVLLTDNADVDPAVWFRASGCTTWVADGSNSLWKIQKWKTLSTGLPLRFHPTSQKGAFILRD